MANRSDVPALTANGGRHAGNASALGLGADLVPVAGSPALGLGRDVPGHVPDSRIGAGVHADAGPSGLGDDIDLENWPRPARTTFTPEWPRRWTAPALQ